MKAAGPPDRPRFPTQRSSASSHMGYATKFASAHRLVLPNIPSVILCLGHVNAELIVIYLVIKILGKFIFTK